MGQEKKVAGSPKHGVGLSDIIIGMCTHSLFMIAKIRSEENRIMEDLWKIPISRKEYLRDSEFKGIARATISFYSSNVFRVKMLLG